MSRATVSFEFFPPRNEAQLSRFWYTFGCLQTLNPAYISMTWGALGAASQASLDILTPLMKQSKVPVTAHLSCSGETSKTMQDKVEALEAIGVSRFLALRGDQASSTTHGVDTLGKSDTMQHASDLVQLLCERGHTDISVAAYPDSHPESADEVADIQWLKHKLDAGARQAITQFFFNADTFLRFRDRAVSAGIEQKLIPGILPIHDIAKVVQFSEKCGAVIPKEFMAHFEKAQSVSEKHEAAVDHCVSLCQELQAEGVDEFHLYTLNQADLCYKIGSELLGVAENRRRGEHNRTAA